MIGLHLGPDQIEIASVVEDRGDDLGADGAGAPLDDGFDNNSVNIEITIN